MEVICEEYQRCEFRVSCKHSKPHNIIKNSCNEYFADCLMVRRPNILCYCISIRKNKLKKLNEKD